MSRRIALYLLLGTLGCSRPGYEPTGTESSEEGKWQALTVTDDMGRKVTLRKRPARIISLAPSITETLFAVGAGPQLAAVTSTDTYPPEVKRLPTVGGFAPETISTEAILARKPDLVLAGGQFQRPIVESMDKLGIPALVIDPTSLDAVEEAISRIGRLTGHEAKAGAVAADFRRRRRAVRRAALAKDAARVRVLYVFWDEPLETAGSGTFVGQMIAEAGGVNIFADLDQDYPQVSDEAVLARNPECILAPNRGGATFAARLSHRPGWNRLAAVKATRISTVPEELLHRPGPRLIDGLEKIAALLHEQRGPARRRTGQRSVNPLQKRGLTP
jgi:iron complex transport system substrate-binding protein